jgi:hypothetical protein
MLIDLIAAMEVDRLRVKRNRPPQVERELFPGNFYVQNTTSTLFANRVHEIRTCTLLIYA